MTAPCSKSISADSLTVMIFCTEGIRGTLTLLNGPMGYVEVVPKTHLGIQGALFIVEQVLSGLMSRL